MSLRKVGTYFNQMTDRKADIYRDVEWNEFRVRFYQHGKYFPNADYHTDDRRDANSTAEYFVNSSGQFKGE